MPEKPIPMLSDGLARCPWCGTDALYQLYHDREWGREMKDDQVLFEFVVLESAQAGLSWITILRKREAYRAAFANFDVQAVAAFSADDADRLLLDAGIVRNRKKIEAAINNAKAFIGIQEAFGSFYGYLTGYLPEGKPIVNHWKSMSEVPPRTELSDLISKDLKKRGFSFFGTTICYAYMQATGMVDDHLIDCFLRIDNG